MTVPTSILTFVVDTFTTIQKLLRAEDDDARQAALMEHHERVKEELDRRAFGGGS
jgi:hypothetical protein